MKIHLYSVVWNEEKILPFFFQHYEPWVDRFYIADNESTDRTPEMLLACRKQTLRDFAVKGDSYIHEQQTDGNRAWKQSRGQADWVIVCDVDEFLYHPNILQYLASAQENGVTIIQAEGYQMVNDAFPDSGDVLTQVVRRGAPNGWMNKTVIFNPDAIEEINYSPGRHTAEPTGRVVYPPSETLKLLHYKFMGLRYLQGRQKALQTRRLRSDLALNYGFQYQQSEKENIKEFAVTKKTAMEVVPKAVG